MSAIGRVIQPSSKAYAQDTGLSGSGLEGLLSGGNVPGKPFASSEDYNSGGGLLATYRRLYGDALDKLGTMFNLPEMGMSEAVAGQPTVGTGISPTSQKAGYAVPTLLGPSVTGAMTQPTPEETFTPSPSAGGNYSFDNAEVGDFLNELINAYASMGTEQLAAVDTSSMDSWYQQALEQSGMNEQQAAMDAINKQIGVVSDLLDNLDADITEESKNFLMTEGQRRRLVATRGKPLRDELSKLVAGASKYGVNIKNTLAMLEQQIGVKKMEAQQRLEAQKSVQASQEAKLKGLTSLMPYMYPTAGQELSSQTQRDIAAMKANENTGSIADLLAG